MRVYSRKYRGQNFRGRGALAACVFLLTAHCLLLTASAQYGRPPEASMPRGGTPEVLKQVDIRQRLNEQIPLDLRFRDEAGREVRLAEYFKRDRPVVLSLVYYECPMLCNQVLNGLVGTLEAVSFTPGQEFEVVTVSFDPREGPELAARKKDTYIKRYRRNGAENGWHFLTGDRESIDRLAQSVGFGYVWDERSQQFAHASAIMVATPEGRLSHYFYGIEYSPKELRLALVEASAGRIGSPVDRGGRPDGLRTRGAHPDPAAAAARRRRANGAGDKRKRSLLRVCFYRK
ncbi:MAG: SCO family protein [Acidobacteria bacterium]|nr:SCO family protein [Acidobacteriota bacterium]